MKGVLILNIEHIQGFLAKFSREHLATFIVVNYPHEVQVSLEVMAYTQEKALTDAFYTFRINDTHFRCVKLTSEGNESHVLELDYKLLFLKPEYTKLFSRYIKETLAREGLELYKVSSSEVQPIGNTLLRAISPALAKVDILDVTNRRGAIELRVGEVLRVSLNYADENRVQGFITTLHGTISYNGTDHKTMKQCIDDLASVCASF